MRFLKDLLLTLALVITAPIWPPPNVAREPHARKALTSTVHIQTRRRVSVLQCARSELRHCFRARLANFGCWLSH
jgi:hypothetical protein